MLLFLKKGKVFVLTERGVSLKEEEEKDIQLLQKKSLGCAQTLYNQEDLLLLDPTAIPKHVAIIMDGNRRWEKKNRMPLFSGHWKGAEVLTHIVRACHALGIKSLTSFAFSTENWSRSSAEVEALMYLFEIYLIRQRKSMEEEGVRFHAIGALSKLPKRIQKVVWETREATMGGKTIDLILAINYGGRDEIVRAMQKIAKEVAEGKISASEINENLVSGFLDTAPWPDPDLLIRTSGEQRLSNFLLWQTSYTEIHIVDAFWPEFSEKHLLTAVLDYQKRKRRWGGT